MLSAIRIIAMSLLIPLNRITPEFSSPLNGRFWKGCRPCFSLVTPEFHFSVDVEKLRLSETMRQTPTPALFTSFPDIMGPNKRIRLDCQQ